METNASPVAGPRVAVLEQVMVSTLLEPVTGFGLKLEVQPAGSPLTLKATEPVKPPVRVTGIVIVPLPPRLIVRLVGLGEIEKSGLETPLGSP